MSSVVLELLHVVDVLVRLHVDAQVTLGGGAVVTNFTPVRFVATRVGLATCQTWMLLSSDAVNAVRI